MTRDADSTRFTSSKFSPTTVTSFSWAAMPPCSGGARRPTYDIDIITRSTARRKPSAAVRRLRELQAGIVSTTLDDALPFDNSAESLRGIQMVNLRGVEMDITLRARRFPDGYTALRPGPSYTVGP